MAGQEIAYLTAVVGADITSFRRGMSEVRQSLLDVGGLSQSLRTTGRNLTLALTVPMGIAGAAALDMAVEFDAAMRNVASISDVVANNFQNSSDTVLEWGSNIRSGPVAAAEALNTVMQAGFGINDFNEALLVAQISATTAEAGLADLTTTTEALVAALLSYGEGADQAAYYSDILTRMVQVGVGSMSEFGNSLAQVLPSAATLGVGFDELGGVMAYLTQRGFPASRAATSLANAFNKLITPSEAMNRVWTELGVDSGQELIDTFGGVQGAFNALFEIAETSPDAARALAAMFPDERGRRAIQLAMSDVDAFNAVMNEFMADVTGATGRAHAEQMRSFAAQFDLMKAAGSELAITIGQHLMPLILPLVVGFRDLFQSLSDTNPELMRLALLVAGAVAAIGPLVWVIGTLLTPVGVLTGLITGLSAAFATDFSGIRTTVMGFIEEAIPGFSDLVREIENFFNTLLGTQYTTEWRAVMVYPPGQDPYEMFLPEVRQLTFLERLQSAFAEHAPALGQAFSDMLSGAVDFVINEGFPFLDNLVARFIDSLSSAFTAKDTTGEGDSPVYYAIRGLLNGGIGKAIENVGSFFEEHFPEFTQAVNTFFNNLGTWIKDEGAPTLGRVIGYALATLGSIIADIIRSLFSGAGEENEIVRAFREGLEAGWNDATKDLNIESGASQVVTLIAGALATLFIGRAFTAGIGTAISNAFNILFGTAISSGGVIAIGGSTFSLLALGGAIVGGIAIAISMSNEERDDVVSSLIQLLTGATEEAADQALKNTQDTIGEALSAVVYSAAAVVADASGNPELAEQFRSWGQDNATSFANAFEVGVDTAMGNMTLVNADTAAIQEENMIHVGEGYGQALYEGFSMGFESTMQRGDTGGVSLSDNLRETYVTPFDRTRAEIERIQEVLSGNIHQKSNVEIPAKLKAGGQLIKEQIDFIKSVFNVTQVTLPTDPFTNALHNLRNAIQPIIDGIVAAWNAMLALVGQQVQVPAPAITPGAGVGGSGGRTGGVGTPGRGGGRATPAFASPGFLGAGQIGLVGDNGPELVRFGRPTALMPKSMYSGESSGMVQNNNITVVTNDPDKLIDELRRRGIDLKKRA